MKFSIIIPIHNGSATISRTLESILKQSKTDDIEIVIVEDNCIDNSIELCHQYDNKINIKYIKTNPESYHCPGNSRELGISVASGEWITFIDQDDIYYSDAFDYVRENIDNDYFVAFKVLINYGEDKDNNLKITLPKQSELDPWLHGKFYNKINLIEDHNIHFKKDLMYAEDVYFNQRVQLELFKLGICPPFTFEYRDVFICEWTATETSVTNNARRVNGKYMHNDYAQAVYIYNFLTQYYKEYFSILSYEHKRILEIPIITMLAQLYQLWLYYNRYDESLRQYLDKQIQKIRQDVCDLLIAIGTTSTTLYTVGNSVIFSMKDSSRLILPQVCSLPTFNKWVKQWFTEIS